MLNIRKVYIFTSFTLNCMLYFECSQPAPSKKWFARNIQDGKSPIPHIGGTPTFLYFDVYQKIAMLVREVITPAIQAFKETSLKDIDKRKGQPKWVLLTDPIANIFFTTFLQHPMFCGCCKISARSDVRSDYRLSSNWESLFALTFQIIRPSRAFNSGSTLVRIPG